MGGACAGAIGCVILGSTGTGALGTLLGLSRSTVGAEVSEGLLGVVGAEQFVRERVL